MTIFSIQGDSPLSLRASIPELRGSCLPPCVSPRWLRASQRGPSALWGRKPGFAGLGSSWRNSVSDGTDYPCPFAGFLPPAVHHSHPVAGPVLSQGAQCVTWIHSRPYASGPFVCWPLSPFLPELFPWPDVPEPESPPRLRYPETSLFALSGHFAPAAPAWRPTCEPFLAVGLWPCDVAFSAPSPRCGWRFISGRELPCPSPPVGW